MFSQQDTRAILFLDVETAPGYASVDDMPEGMRHQWDLRVERMKRYNHDIENQDQQTAWEENAGIPAEFSRIVCISCGYLTWEGNTPVANLKSFSGTDEVEVLSGFARLLGKLGPEWRLCGHNIKEFDIPVICRRSIINGLLPLPRQLQIYGKKPWEMNFADTLELWKFGDNRSFVSLALLTEVLGLPSPKGDMDGSMVGKVYWRQGDLPRIQHYCEQDVKAVMNVVLRLSGLPILEA